MKINYKSNVRMLTNRFTISILIIFIIKTTVDFFQSLRLPNELINRKYNTKYSRYLLVHSVLISNIRKHRYIDSDTSNRIDLTDEH